MLSYDLNLRAILAAYMIGTGGFDITRFMTMMGVEDGSSFERKFYRSGGLCARGYNGSLYGCGRFSVT